MGRANRPRTPARRDIGRVGFLIACATFALGASAFAPIASQALAQTAAKPAAAAEKPKDKLLVEAKEIVYDKDKNTVAAVGNAQLYYQGRVLEADKVTYDRASNRVYAEGNAKLTDENGNITHADRFELTDNFRDGFIDTLRLDTKDKTHFTAPRAERTDGETTVFNKATYTACEPCKEHPERPPLWQVKARRIIHNNEEHIVYFEHATLEFLGVPLLYVPYISAPDPTVSRKTGFLTPHYIHKSSLGNGVAVPFFWNIAPNYDLTLTPQWLSRQGFFGEAEWRHRLLNGSYNVRVSGIDQQDRAAFAASPYGAASLKRRGSVESAGKFLLSDKWTFGWDLTRISDRFFFNDYRLPAQNVSVNYFKESISTVYLNGQGERGYFDLRGYQIQALSASDNQRTQPLVLPVWDYNKTIDLPKDRTAGIGGELTLDYNLTSLSRKDAAFQATGSRQLDKVFGLYDVCETLVPGTKATYQRTYNPGQCFLRGVGGDYSRVSVQASWQRKYIDPIGQVWQPFAFFRGDAAFVNPNNGGGTFVSNGATSSSIVNADQANFLGYNGSTALGRAMPGVGLEYRYPFFADSGWATHVVEPIAQVVVRPNEATRKRLPNEDAQSLVFDDTTVFEWNKFSGYDRIEGGTRANVGGQYTLNLKNGGYANILAAQSFQLAGRNSYAAGDVADAGLNSGLDRRRSDYVTRVALAPVSNFNITAKGRFDEDNFALKRLDVISNASYGRASLALQYARYAAQPEIGFPKRREGFVASTSYGLTDNWRVSGSVLIDLARFLYDVAPQKSSRVSATSVGLGLLYKDECTTMSINFSSSLSDPGTGNKSRAQTVLFRLELRTLGEIKTKAGLPAIKVQDALPATATN